MNENQSAAPAPAKAAKLERKMPLLILGLIVAVYAASSLRVLRAELSTTGMIVFPADDAYIGMALAKNLALHGVMGISAGRFVSATSCPGFLMLLASVYLLTGPTAWVPLVLSLAFGLFTLFMARELLSDTPWGIQLATLGAIVCFTPLHIIGLLGMEHTLHIMLVLAFLHLAGKAVAEGKSPSWGLLALASLMVSVRYESLFMIGVTCLLFALQRQMVPAVRLGLAAMVPVAVYGAIAVGSGSYWLPQSIALKGLSVKAPLQASAELVLHFKECFVQAPYVGALLGVIAMLLLMPDVRANKRVRSMLIIVSGATLVHFALAGVGWVYRYEAYLIAAALASIGCALPFAKFSRARLASAGALAFAVAGAWLLTLRTVDAETTLPWRSAAVYYQQIQMARFLQRSEQGASVAANDVGAINFYADINCLDLVGLADRDVFTLKRNGAFSTAALSKLAADRQVKIALVYEPWFSILPLTGLRGLGGPPLPATWIRVAQWRTPYAQYLGGELVSFYGTDAAAAEELRDALARFGPSLPPQVQVIWK